jgi:hypothetical protein
MRWLKLLLFLALGAAAYGAPCAVGPLSGYLGGTCSSHGIDFSGWTYDPDGTGVDPAAILVTPSVVSPVFIFYATTPWTAGTGILRTPAISATASGAAHAVAAYLLLAAGSSTGSGRADVTFDLCLGGCPGGTSFPLTASSLGPISSILPLPGSYALIDFDLRIALNGGSGSATVDTVTAGLFTVPEPVATLPLGLASLWLLRRLSRRHPLAG